MPVHQLWMLLTSDLCVGELVAYISFLEHNMQKQQGRNYRGCSRCGCTCAKAGAHSHTMRGEERKKGGKRGEEEKRGKKREKREKERKKEGRDFVWPNSP